MKRIPKTAVVYLLLAVFALVFERVYALFSHDVFSASMLSMWIVLLVLGTGLFSLFNLIYPPAVQSPRFRYFRYTYHCGVATLVDGLLLKGILEIAGATSGYIPYFFYAAYGLFTAAVLLFLLGLFDEKKGHP